MSAITLRSLKKDFGIKEILRDASFSLGPADKVGVIGTNGAGKSTMLKMMAGLEPADSGTLWTNPSLKVVYLPQQPNLDDERTVLEQVFADSGEKAALVQEYEALSAQLAQHSGNLDQIMARLSQVTHRMDTIGAWDLETQSKIVLTKLGIENFDAKVGSLSGGYRKRIALATALLSNPDVLLMDEPTNHLDALSVEWLQSYLQRFHGALLLITHDRYFLDQVVNTIVEIDRGDLYAYEGNYSYYLEKKALAEDVAASAQRKHAGVLRRELEWLKRGPKARSTKQKARIDRIRAMQTQEFKQAKGKVEISTAGRRIGKKVVDINAVAKGFEGRSLIRNFSYNFSPEDRIGIIGPNGVGKSTLLNLITGRLQPDAGTVDIGDTIVFGYFDQHSDDLALNPEQRVIDYLKDIAELITTADGTVITASQMLERFLFTPNQQYSPIERLSGGEKRRLFLLKVLMAAPNVLILDEPTNDLDVQTLAVLEDYLEDFNGCVMVVSHDRYFLDRTVDTIFAFQPDGTLRQYPGNYSVYLDFKQAEEATAAKAEAAQAAAQQSSSKAETQTVTTTTTATTPPTSQSRKRSYKEKRELEQLEAQIPEMELQKADLEKQLYHNPPSGFTELTQLSERLAELGEAIDTATLRWMELSELAE
ncbi:MAG TPA: ABC-F family ATP-binding cassette domain-containing protein [Stenomitos sp.]